MTGERREEIRRFILDIVEAHPSDVVRLANERFGISRQMAHRYVRGLVIDGLLVGVGTTSGRRYSLRSLVEEQLSLRVTPEASESELWRLRVRPRLGDLRKNILDICQYGFTEMFNNVIEHSAAETASVGLKLDAVSLEMSVHDDGVGIFNKIARELGLEDPRVALFELSKGKLTTDSQRHTGEGIFFASRLFDRFHVFSGGLFYSHSTVGDDWFVETGEEDEPAVGTTVVMNLAVASNRTLKGIFDRFASAEEDYGFSRTHVPVRLASYDEEKLLSRSQARRLLARVEQFKEVTLDFDGVDFIGQAFADEIFRVFRNEHPEVAVYPVRANEDVEKMMRRAGAGADEP